MSFSNSPVSFMDEDKYNAEKLLAYKYIREREERASAVQNILAPITPQDEFIFDMARGDDDSDISELSDPFAELGGNIVLSAENKQKRRLSKVEADILVMNSFPPAHMEIQNSLTAAMDISKGPQIDIEKIMDEKCETVQSEESDDDILQSVAASLNQCGIKNYVEEKRKREERDMLRQSKPRAKKSKNNEDLQNETNSLSGIWRMLDAKSMDNFPITQAGYNFFEENKAWVNPAESSWNEKEEIRKKCEDWLKNVK